MNVCIYLAVSTSPNLNCCCCCKRKAVEEQKEDWRESVVRKRIGEKLKRRSRKKTEGERTA
jgi:hypothetical protein